jgi:hypothetical protein
LNPGYKYLFGPFRPAGWECRREWIWNIKMWKLLPKLITEKIAAWRKDVESAIPGTIARRLCTAGDLAQIPGTHVNKINKYPETLESEGKLTRTREERGVFYRSL